MKYPYINKYNKVESL